MLIKHIEFRVYEFIYQKFTCHDKIPIDFEKFSMIKQKVLFSILKQLAVKYA